MQHHKRQTKNRWWPTMVVAAMTLLMLPACLLARAGGGHAFHGGGGGGGFGGGGHGFGGGGGGFHTYGGGGGGGGMDGFGLFIFFVIIIIVLAFRFWQWQQQQQGTSYRPDPTIRPNRFQQLGMLDQLRARDPAFDEAAFLHRVGQAFVGLQDAWCAQELSRVRPFLSDGVHERFSLQFNEQKAGGYRDHMDNLQVAGSQIAKVASDESFDAITVRIVARANDYPVSLIDGHRMPGPSSYAPFSEYWSFLRRRGRGLRRTSQG